MKQLSGPGQAVAGGGTDTPGAPHDTANDKSNGLSTLTAQGTQTAAISQIQDQQQPDNTPTPPPCTENCGPAPPVTFDVQVYRPGKTYTYNGITIDHPGQSGILGGDPNETIDDFKTTATYSDGRITGDINGIGVVNDSCSDCTPEYGTIETHHFDFPYSTTPGFYAIIPSSSALITSASETISLIGSLYVDTGFFAYQLFEDSNKHKPVLAFGGTPYSFTPDGASPVVGLNPGQLHSFTLLPDPRENSPLPFASAESTPGAATFQNAQPLLVLQDANPVWLQTSFVISGDGSQQQSFVLVALGGENDGGGLVGGRGGSSHLPVTVDNGDGETDLGSQTINFAGGIATLPGPDGNYYYGTTTPHFLIGHDTLNGNPGVDEPLNAGALRGRQQFRGHLSYRSANGHAGCSDQDRRHVPRLCGGDGRARRLVAARRRGQH